jgi:hypothetical protein
MSMPLIPSITASASAAHPDRPPCWFNILARYTRKRREELDLSLERAAELAGLENSEWDALESGWWVPASDNLPLIRAIAGALEVSWMDYSILALMAACQQRCPEEDAGQA